MAGVVPALQLSRPDLTHSLKESARAASAGRGRQRLRSALVVAEVALAVVLLVGAALFIGSFIALMRIDPGFTPEGVITTYISPRNEPGQRPPDRSALFTQILERVSHAPGVVSAAVSVGGVPLGFRARINGLSVKGREDVGQHARLDQTGDARLPHSAADSAQERAPVRRDAIMPVHHRR